jgi:hypothetical protein
MNLWEGGAPVIPAPKKRRSGEPASDSVSPENVTAFAEELRMRLESWEVQLKLFGGDGGLARKFVETVSPEVSPRGEASPLTATEIPDVTEVIADSSSEEDVLPVRSPGFGRPFA